MLSRGTLQGNEIFEWLKLKFVFNNEIINHLFPLYANALLKVKSDNFQAVQIFMYNDKSLNFRP